MPCFGEMNMILHFLTTILMLTKILRLWSMPKSHRGREVVTNLWCRHLTGSSQLWRHNTSATWCTRVHGIPAQRCISVTSSYSKFLMAFCLRYIFRCWSVCHQTKNRNMFRKASIAPLPRQSDLGLRHHILEYTGTRRSQQSDSESLEGSAAEEPQV